MRIPLHSKDKRVSVETSVVSNEELFTFLKIKRKAVTSKFHPLRMRCITCIVSRAGNDIESTSTKSKLVKPTQNNMFVHYIVL